MLNSTHRTHLRRILRIFHPNHITNTAVVYTRCQVKPLSIFVHTQRWKLFGHVLRSSRKTPAQKAMDYYMKQREAGTKGNKGRTRTTLPTVLHSQLQRAIPTLKKFLQGDEETRYMEEMKRKTEKHHLQKEKPHKQAKPQAMSRTKKRKSESQEQAKSERSIRRKPNAKRRKMSQKDRSKERQLENQVKQPRSKTITPPPPQNQGTKANQNDELPQRLREIRSPIIHKVYRIPLSIVCISSSAVE